MSKHNEAEARIKINKLLEKAGWRFLDDENGRSNIQLEKGVKLKLSELEKLGEDFQGHKNGRVDFLLLDDKGFPFIVLEAKSEKKNPLAGKEQARDYANSLGVRYVLLSNGNSHYFWDIELGNPDAILSFPNYDSFKAKKELNLDPEYLVKENVEDDYIAVTQRPDYKEDPSWIDEELRENFIFDNGLRFLRPYQLNAVHSIQQKVRKDKSSKRFLFEMATGTGKTLVSAAVMKMFLRSKVVSRVLFLVDRLELENQALKDLNTYLKNDFDIVIYKENKDDWNKAEIVISTVQSFLHNDKYQDLFSPTDFDLVISDEAHRSISGNSRAVFEYFLGYKLGLTATPKNYLKGVDFDDEDPRKVERRQLLDTYKTFGCENSEPTFRYSLLDGVREGYLINPIVADARTKITTKLLSDEGYAVLEENEKGEKESKFLHTDFEKKFFSDETNLSFCKTFMEHALKDPITGEIGKSIVFCVKQSHAYKITQTLNEIAHAMFPGKYNSDFAIQVTSDISNAQQFTINFANNNLRGHSGFLEGYDTSKARVCVTVGMMTTGYDCPDLLNVALMRPIFSPSDFVQIKGRGTRKCKFEFNKEGKIKGWDSKVEEKVNFKLFDFFANCEYFDEKFDYDEKLELPKDYVNVKTGRSVSTFTKKYVSAVIDPLKHFKQTKIGLEGMKIDRKLFETFSSEVKKDDLVKNKIDSGDFEFLEDYIREKYFNDPRSHFDLEKLRKSVNLDRKLSIREMLEKIFGMIDQFKSKNEMLEGEVRKFVQLHEVDEKHYEVVRSFLKAYISDSSIREVIDNGEFSALETNPKFPFSELKKLGKDWRERVVEYVNTYVNLSQYS